MDETQQLEQLAINAMNMNVADSLVGVDFPEGLTPIELAFCRHHAEGKNPTKAFMCAQSDAGVPINKAKAAANAGRLIRRPDVVKYLEELRRAMETTCVAKGAALQAFLSAVVMTPIDEIDGSSVLCHKKTHTIKTSKDGSTTETFTYEMPNKMEAVKQLSRMQGLDAPVKIDHTHTGGVMIMPMSKNVQEWSNAIADQQKSLMDDALNV